MPDWLDAHAIEQITTHALRRVTAAARDGSLLAQPRAMELLGYWHLFEKAEFEPWIRSAVAGDATLLELVEAFHSSQESSEGSAPGPDVFHSEYLAELLPPDKPIDTLLTDLERMATAGAQPLQRRALRLAPYLRKHIKEYSATAPAVTAQTQVDAPMIDTDAGGGNS